MKMMLELEILFDKEMFNINDRAREKCDYNAVRFLQMLIEKGGIATAKQLFVAGILQEGFVHLWECGCLDLTVETLMLQDRFQDLFTEKELEVAHRRLEELGYYK